MPENITAMLRLELNQVEDRMQKLDERKRAILNLLGTYEATGGTSGRAGKVLSMPRPESRHLSTLDMAESVIAKRGPMKAEEVMEAIRQEFGAKPAHTLPQMLYIRARARKRFYRSADGRFGLIQKKRPAKRAA